MRKIAAAVLLFTVLLLFARSAEAQSRGEGIGALFSPIDGDTTVSIVNGKTAPWSEVTVENAAEEIQAVAKLNEKGLVNFTFLIKSGDLGSIYIYATDEAGITNKVLILGTTLDGEVLPPTITSVEEESLPEDNLKLSGFSYPEATIRVAITSDQGYNGTFSAAADETTGGWELLVNALGKGSYTVKAVSAVGSRESRESQELYFEIGSAGPIDTLISIITDQLGPLAEIVGSLSNSFSNAVENTLENVTAAVQALPESVKQVSNATSKVAIPLTLLGLFLQAGLVTIQDLGLLLSQYLAIASGFPFLPVFFEKKKKKRAWGVLYDAVTKQPLAQGLIRLLDEKGKFIDMEVTNAFGVFAFLPQKGKYKLEASRAGYEFPSQVVSREKDGEYESIYHGEVFEVLETKPTVSLSVPIDPRGAQKPSKIKQLFRKHGSAINLPLLTGGLLLSGIAYLAIPNLYNQVIAGFYVVALSLVAVNAVKTERYWGTVKDGKGNRAGGVALSLVDAKTGKLIQRRVTNTSGRYQFVAPTGSYKILIASVEWERQNTARSYKGEELIVAKKIEPLNPPIVIRKKPKTALKRRETL
ncbi:MAG: hypothetical protein BMS9Abin34_017 [Patescibacteria group bacterium]|nr:MAG: hypothetical protein BMS9Abin34_017 [Patescibacteria group bacterium]